MQQAKNDFSLEHIVYIESIRRASPNGAGGIRWAETWSRSIR